ncbi:hypothetical protein EKO27_g10631 [Xylaria grammica]|uniref:Uncharacterized protein n=1 Tax=Xylaria grammica TaxID=363999 RepID=A0A439CQU7_9PEZI|nr:hypothetical protein EKO27_g10631 [Xylaria grammica]
MKLFTASLAALLAPVFMVHAKPTHQFDHFFPGWNERVQTILRENCSAPYAEYLTGEVPEGVGAQGIVNPLIDCILEVFPESRKAELATGALVLGLIPTILQTIGSSTVETALVGLRRPLLGFLISAGSPAVSMTKTSDFARSVREFVDGSEPREMGIDALRWSRGRGKWAVLIALLEYVVVGGAVANVLHLAWELGIYAVAIFAPDTIFGVPLWTLGASLIHLTGCLALWASGHMVPTQLIPAVFQPSMTLELRQDKGSTFWFYVLSWIISIGILAQVAFGTLVLSGLLFFSLADCLIIVGRYTLSAVVCRAVVRLELSGMMAAMVPVKGNDMVEPEQVVLTGWKRQPSEM